MQANLAEHLYNLNIKQHNMCANGKQFRDIVNHDYNAILNTLGQY